MGRLRLPRPEPPGHPDVDRAGLRSGGGTMQSESLRRTRVSQFELFELQFLNSSFPSLSSLIEIRQKAPCRAIRCSSISVSSTLPPFLGLPLRRSYLSVDGELFVQFQQEDKLEKLELRNLCSFPTVSSPLPRSTSAAGRPSATSRGPCSEAFDMT